MLFVYLTYFHLLNTVKYTYWLSERKEHLEISFSVVYKQNSSEFMFLKLYLFKFIYRFHVVYYLLRLQLAINCGFMTLFCLFSKRRCQHITK